MGAAQLEGSKMFAKSVMDAAMRAHRRLLDVRYACRAPSWRIAEADGNVVVKADGLAAGKGVFVCSSVAEAEAAVEACLIDRRFGVGRRPRADRGAAGRAPRCRCSRCATASACVALAPARDHKRLGDGDAGPNTGGMGCYSPIP